MNNDSINNLTIEDFTKKENKSSFVQFGIGEVEWDAGDLNEKNTIPTTYKSRYESYNYKPRYESYNHETENLGIIPGLPVFYDCEKDTVSVLNKKEDNFKPLSGVTMTPKPQYGTSVQVLKEGGILVFMPSCGKNNGYYKRDSNVYVSSEGMFTCALSDEERNDPIISQPIGYIYNKKLPVFSYTKNGKFDLVNIYFKGRNAPL